MYEEFNDYLKYNYLRHTLTHNQYRPKDKGLYAYTLLSLQEEIKQNLGDKITFLAWLELMIGFLTNCRKENSYLLERCS